MVVRFLVKASRKTVPKSPRDKQKAHSAFVLDVNSELHNAVHNDALPCIAPKSPKLIMTQVLLRPINYRVIKHFVNSSRRGLEPKIEWYISSISSISSI